MAVYTPIVPTTPITPGKVPFYLGKLTRTDLSVYSSQVADDSASSVNVDSTVTVETDPTGTTFLQPEKPVNGDFMIFTSKVNYWYSEPGLVTKFTTAGKPAGDFERALGAYAGIYQGSFASYVDYKGVKRVKSFLVKVTMPFNQQGQVIDTDYLLWVPAETQFGAPAKTQFEVSGNGYGDTVVIPKSTATTTETKAAASNINWLIILAVALWVLKKRKRKK